MRLPRLRSIAAKLVLAGLLVEVCMLSLLLLSNTRIMQHALAGQFNTRLVEVEGLLEAALAAPLVQRDYATLQDVLDTVHSHHGVEYLVLTDRGGRVMAAIGQPRAAPDVYDTTMPVSLSGQVYGTLRLGVSTAFFDEARRSLLTTGIAIALGEMLLSALILSAVAYRMTRRLRALGRASEAMARGDLAARLDVRGGRDEIDHLADSFNRMAVALGNRLDELRDSQQRLVAATGEAEEARRHTELILATPEEGICGVDPDGLLVFVNPAARRMLGWGEDDGVGASMHAAVHHHRADGSVCDAATCMMTQTLADGRPRRVEDEVFWRKDGSSVPVEYSVTAIRGDGRPAGAVVVFRDISERLEAARNLMDKTEQLARSNAELEQFAYIASHDLREPLRMVSSYLSLIGHRYADRLDAEGNEFLAFAREGAVRMDQMVRDLLEFSRVGRRSGPVIPTSLAEAAAAAARSLGPAAAEAGAELRIAPDLPMVNGDSTELARLMLNLMGNAIKYRAPGRAPVVEVGWRRQGDMVEVWVEDNGIGIAPQYFDQIFLIFRRLHERQAHGGGSGIGLAICKKIVERHGGRIWVESEEGAGTAFHLTLPAAPMQSQLTIRPSIG